MANELRTAGNKINLVGYVKEQKLKEGKGESGEYINGSIVIKTGEFSEIELKVFVSKMNKDGTKVKKNYEVLKQLLDGELPTLADGGEETTIVTVYGNKEFTPTIKENRYANKEKEEVIARPIFDLGFGNIKVTNDKTEEDFEANYDIEIYVNEIVDEVKVVGEDEEETGRVLVKGYLPLYGGDIMPITLVAPKEIKEDEEDENSEVIELAELIKDEIDEGDTINVYGTINYEKIVEKKKKGGKIGKAKTDTKTTYVSELLIEGADFLEDEEQVYEEEDIKKALKERKIKLEEILENAQKEDEEDSSSKKSKGVGTKKTKKRDIAF